MERNLLLVLYVSKISSFRNRTKQKDALILKSNLHKILQSIAER